MAIVTDGCHKCCACKESKPTSEFSKNRLASCGLQYQCKPCASIARKRTYGNNDRKYSREGMRVKRLAGQAWLTREAAKRGGCADYGKAVPGWDGLCFEQWTEDNYLFLEWDHLPDYKKKFELSHCGKPTWILELEVAKCEPVCHNHHLLRTQQRRASKVNP